LAAIGPVVSEEKIKMRNVEMWNVDGRTMDGRRTNSDGNSSHGLRAGELKITKISIKLWFSNVQMKKKHQLYLGAELTKAGADWTRGRNDYLGCWNDNSLINIRNQQVYVGAKQTINALLKLMVKLNTQNLQLYVLAKQTINALLKLMVKMNTRNWKKGRLNSEKIWKIWKKRKLNSEMKWKILKKSKLKSEKIRKLFSFVRFFVVLFTCVSRF
jgi:hypothetical protein